MTDFFRKLNTLVKSSVNDVLSEIPPNRTRRPPSPDKLEPEIARLRDRINQAIVYEDELQAKIVALQNEIDQLDMQADEAVMQGKEEVARHLIERMQRERQRLTMLESDLHSHQLVAQDLILQVNRFEAALADARSADSASESAHEEHGSAETQRRRVIDAIDNVIRDTQERISRREAEQRPQAGDATASLEDQESKDDAAAVDDDLSDRRQRLSKR